MSERVAQLGEIEEGGSKIVIAEGREIALFKVLGKIYALENACPHRGGPLGDGHLEGNRVTCPWHAWQFDVASGICLTVPESRQKTYPVRIEGDEIIVEAGSSS